MSYVFDRRQCPVRVTSRFWLASFGFIIHFSMRFADRFCFRGPGDPPFFFVQHGLFAAEILLHSALGSRTVHRRACTLPQHLSKQTPAASNCSLIRKSCRSHFDRGFNRSKPLCSTVSAA